MYANSIYLPLKGVTTISHLGWNIVILTNHVYNGVPKVKMLAMPIITAPGRPRRKDCEFKAHKDHTTSFYFKMIAKKKPTTMKMFKFKS